MSMRSIIALLSLLVSVSLPASAGRIDPALAKGEDHFFRFYYYTGSNYLRLRPDRTYVSITRQHLFVEERDRGTWKQLDNGDILLKSDTHYHDISSGRLTVYVWKKQKLALLPALKVKISNFLRQKPERLFKREEVEGIHEEVIFGDPDLKRSTIRVLNKVVRREALQGLRVAIDAFLASDTKNVFRLKPLFYRSSIIFVEEDRVLRKRRIIERELAGPPDPAYSADKHGFLEIDAETYAYETQDTQPFLSLPEMNTILEKTE